MSRQPGLLDEALFIRYITGGLEWCEKNRTIFRSGVS